MTKDQMRQMCLTETGEIKSKAECRAMIINHLILEEMMDIDEAENLTDATLREFNLWNEPMMEELLRDEEETDEEETIVAAKES